MHSLGAAALAFAAASSACGDDPASVALRPVVVEGSTCGRPADGRSLLVTALGEQREDVRPVDLGAQIAIADFPAGTRQLAVEVLGAGGAVRAFGRTAPLELSALADGDVIPIFMAPPDDGCPVGDLGEPRDRPLVIAAGDGALVVGGFDGDGAPLGTAEWYDPATATFTPVETPQAMRGPRGAAGMTATRLPDGRVVLIGGDRPVYVAFDPATRTFAAPGALFVVRAHAAAVAIDETRVLVAGGCGLIDDDGACTPLSGQLSTFVVDVSTGEILDGPMMTVERIGGAGFLEPDPTGAGVRRVVLTGGVDVTGAPVTGAERIDPDAGPGTSGVAIDGAGGIAAPLASGSVVVAFGAAAASGAAAVVVPGQADARSLGVSLPRAAPTLTALEDGGVLVVGGAGDTAPVARLRPADGSLAVVDSDPVDLAGAAFARAGHGAARLPDGTVLAAGGHDASGDALAGAWRFRPAGDGPFSGAVTVTPGDDANAPLVPLDPARVTASPAYLLGSDVEALVSWVVIGGMQPRDAELTATVRVDGGVAILLGFVDAEHFDAIELRDGAPARLTRRDGDATAVRCTGEVASLGGGASIAIAVTARDGRIDASVAGAPVLACPFDDARAGLTGVAALGEGAEVTLSTASVAR